MKILMIFATSEMSAVLVLPTVSPAQPESIAQQPGEPADRHSGGMNW